jgi:hypothetical protein
MFKEFHRLVCRYSHQYIHFIRQSIWYEIPLNVPVHTIYRRYELTALRHLQHEYAVFLFHTVLARVDIGRSYYLWGKRFT